MARMALGEGTLLVQEPAKQPTTGTKRQWPEMKTTAVATGVGLAEKAPVPDKSVSAKKASSPLDPESEAILQFVGNRIYEFRKHQGLSQAELAAKAGLAAGTILLVERGKQNPSITVLNAIASAMKVEVGDLMTQKGTLTRAQVKACCEALRDQLERQRSTFSIMDSVISELEANLKD